MKYCISDKTDFYNLIKSSFLWFQKGEPDSIVLLIGSTEPERVNHIYNDICTDIRYASDEKKQQLNSAENTRCSFKSKRKSLELVTTIDPCA